jgi:hypothetical protein
MGWRKKNMTKMNIREEEAKDEEREHNALSHS